MGRRLGVALLAAGASRRFGEADKLAVDFRGERLGEHAALALAGVGYVQGWVITSAPDHPCERTWRSCGFTPLINPNAHKGMGTSVALAAKVAEQASLDGLLIALGDMPLVPQEHFEALIDVWDVSEPIVVSAKGDVRMPPALFSSGQFKALQQSTGDQGARVLIEQGLAIPCPPGWLKDVDRPEDF
ncbi:MAG: nucleotidyltransferase family protein [Pseudomonadota bacterium]